MPTICRVGPYRFFCFASDGDEPQHVHVERDMAHAKFWLDPVRLDRSSGFRSHEINRIHEIVEENREHLIRSWTVYFGN